MEIDCGQAVDVLWSTNSSFLGAVLTYNHSKYLHVTQ